MFFILVILFNFVFLTTAKCPPGSVTFFKDKDHCLIFQTNKTLYLDAEETCINLGGHLVSVHDSTNNMFLAQQALVKFTDSTDSDFWFGLSDLSSPQKWSWMDDTPFDYSNWDKGQPQNVSDSDCGAVLMNGGKWKTDDCYKAKPFVCMIKAIDMPQATTTAVSKSCPQDWTFYYITGYCYKVFENSNWLDAEDYCKIDDAHLVSIHSDEEDRFVADLANYPGADVCSAVKQGWIGLYTEDNYTNWKWTDGTPTNYLNWYSTNPILSGTNNCVYMHLAPICNEKIGMFANGGAICSGVLNRFICKKKPE